MTRRTSAVALLVAAVLPLVPTAPARAQTLDERQRKITDALQDTEHDLHESSAAVRAAAAELSRTAVALPRARAAHASARGQLAAARARHDAVAAQLRGAEAAAASGQRATRLATERLQATRVSLNSLARAAYMAGPSSYVGVVLESRTPSDLLDRTTFLRSAFRDRDATLRAFADARAQLAARQAALDATRREVDAARREAAVVLDRVKAFAEQAEWAKADIDRAVAARRGALAVAEREKAADQRRYQQLLAESRQLAELIRRAARSRGTGKVGKGGLLWPTPGPITSRYGYRTHPIYGYRRFHAGIDIGAPSGQAIVAVKSGVVVHAGRMGSYGNLVVIDHGDGFSTAYAHQSRVAVSSGAQVAAGRVLGFVGSTGASTGPHLHFETRVNGDPVDPLQYY